MPINQYEVRDPPGVTNDHDEGLQQRKIRQGCELARHVVQ